MLQAADGFPGLVPDAAALAAEAQLPLREKEAVRDRSGHPDRAHPGPSALRDASVPCDAAASAGNRGGAGDAGGPRFRRSGRRPGRTARPGGASACSNARYLNAEDQQTIAAFEIGVDVATLDPGTDIAVFRGQPVENPKYAGRRIFGSGINLTHLYRGTIPFVWYLQRDLGFVHKLLRGVASREVLPDDVNGAGHEKPGSPPWRVGPSAATARSCWRWIMCSPPRTPS